MVTGIVPQHILGTVNPAQLRANAFNNQAPVGSGPFSFSKVEVVGTASNDRQERVALNASDTYNFGRPKIDKFIIRTFGDKTSLTSAYDSKELNAMLGLTALPDQFANDDSTIEYGVPLTGEVLVFFKTTQEVLKDAQVRKALVLATNKKEVFSKLSYPLASADEPLLKIHTGYDKTLKQQTGNVEEAKKTLDAAGWIVDPATGIRAKAGQKLAFRLYSQSTSEYASVTGSLQKQWKDIGVDMQVELQSDQDLQSTLALHNYDALLYGISIGPDPDVYAYWHSTQADPRSTTRLNFSEYKSTLVDRALEGGRARSDPQLRSAKYRPFLEEWVKDAPALALYQPRFLYIVRAPLYGFDQTSANTASDRYSNVHNWQIRDGLEK
jgi:peptide/nickel transport system substrate-binding protein